MALPADVCRAQASSSFTKSHPPGPSRPIYARASASSERIGLEQHAKQGIQVSITTTFYYISYVIQFNGHRRAAAPQAVYMQ